jgi:tetratricopeptide (TPR) repeat protein
MVNRAVAWKLKDPWILEAQAGRIAFARAGKSAHYVTEDETEELLNGDPKPAEDRARQAIEADPADTQARVLLGAALRQQKRYREARDVLEPVVAAVPHMALALREFGLALVWLGEREKGIDTLLRAIDLQYADKSAWFWLGEFLEFEESGSKSQENSPPDPHTRLTEARLACREDRFKDAEAILREVVASSPEDAEALKLLGEALARMGRWREAKPLLEKSVELVPDSVATRFRCATMLFAFGQFVPALQHIDELLRRDATNRLYRQVRMVCLSRARHVEDATAEFEAFIEEYPDRPGLWIEYARLIKSGQRGDILRTVQRAIQILPDYVEAYLTAAFTKSVKLDETFVGQVRTQVAREGFSYEDRARLHFALGKAFEDMKQYGESFEHYRLSNDILCTSRDFGPEQSARFKNRMKRFYKPRFFRAREGWGCPAPDPIFIVGMPRSGSTLVEQILSSHSQIEGLGELRDLGEITERLTKEAREQQLLPFPVMLRELDADRLRSFGEEYLQRSRGRRQTDRPLFTDKMPGNFNQVGFIHLILPNAKIIDARRHPLDCCFSCFKHYFPAGQPLSTNLRDVGRGYVDYVELMGFFDDILPGRVHRVIYEQLVDDPEREVRRMLDYVGLPFEEQCLRFHENKRFVMTISQEQVRMPLYKTGMEQWRSYEPWLGPLKEELGYVLDLYPDVPKYFTEIHAKWNEPLGLGQGANPFATVKGVGQVPFEIAQEVASLAA